MKINIFVLVAASLCVTQASSFLAQDVFERMRQYWKLSKMQKSIHPQINALKIDVTKMCTPPTMKIFGKELPLPFSSIVFATPSSVKSKLMGKNDFAGCFDILNEVQKKLYVQKVDVCYENYAEAVAKDKDEICQRYGESLDGLEKVFEEGTTCNVDGKSSLPEAMQCIQTALDKTVSYLKATEPSSESSILEGLKKTYPSLFIDCLTKESRELEEQARMFGRCVRSAFPIELIDLNSSVDESEDESSETITTSVPTTTTIASTLAPTTAAADSADVATTAETSTQASTDVFTVVYTTTNAF